MKNPRLSFTINESDAEVLDILAKKKEMTMSSLLSKIISDWLEDYEDSLLAVRAIEAEREWIKGGRKTISHEDLWKELGIE
jgi:predicted DNA-binding protein